MVLKVAFYPMGQLSWIAGEQFLKNLIYALHYTYAENIKCYLVDPHLSVTINDKLSSCVDGILKIQHTRRLTSLWFGDYIYRTFFSYNLKETLVLRKAGVNVIFGAAIADHYGSIPTLSWIWDFQHRHLPMMFSHDECIKRERHFLSVAQNATRIIVKSKSIQDDFQKFIPRYAHKVRVLQFFNHIPESVYTSDQTFLRRLYNLPEKFIYVPNQFWKHKNHEMLIRVVKELKESGIRMHVVFSGYPHDERNPSYFVDLMRNISAWNIREEIIYLGMVHSEHVLLLMRESAFVLNPSLFEGFGMAVNEAGMLGKKILLSDIPAHHEHNFPQIMFFNHLDPQDFRKKMVYMWEHSQPGPDIEMERQARELMPARLQKCAQSFVSIAQEVIGKSL